MLPFSTPLILNGIGIATVITILVLIIIPLTLLISSIFLWRYRVAVARLMAKHSGFEEKQIPINNAHGSAHLITNHNSRLDKLYNNYTDHLYNILLSEPWRNARKYTLSGIFFALIVSLGCLLAFSQIGSLANPFQRGSYSFYYFLFVFCIFAWPIVLTINIITSTTWYTKIRTIFIYSVILAMSIGLVTMIPNESSSLHIGNITLPARSETPLTLIGKWNLFNLAPTLLIISFRNRHIRAVAPLVLSFITIVSIGWLWLIIMVFYIYNDISGTVISITAEFFNLNIFLIFIGYILLFTIIACISFGVIGWKIIYWIRSNYLQKKNSDQSLSVDTVWIIFAAFYALILAIFGPGWVVFPCIAFFIFKIVLQVNNKLNLSKFKNDYGLTLLVLRVFSLGKRSENLFNSVTKYWRYIGDVKLIVGSDLASSTVAPHQFLAFISGKLNQMFVNSETTIYHNLNELDRQRDFDGRFRINTLFCHADTWRSVVSRLITEVDVVLMDLRNLSEGNDGCVFELNELLNFVPLQQLILIIDVTTDKKFLHQTLERFCSGLRLESPNFGITPDQVQLFFLESLGHHKLRKLFHRLSTATSAREHPT